AIELEGLELFPIHGTWGDVQAWSNPGMMDLLQNLFGNTETIIRIRKDSEGNPILRKEQKTSWSGFNADKARRQAAKEYVDFIKASMIEGEPITILGHSHGGNVSVLIMDMIANDPYFEGVELNLITLNTPSREYKLSGFAINNVDQYNVFNRKDPVQISGGSLIKLGAGKSKFGELFGAKRTFTGAFNIEYESAATGIKGYHQGWRIENFKVWFPQLKQEVHKKANGKVRKKKPNQPARKYEYDN
ncbi:MAG: hypothetical protein JKX73_03740, partial [Flavobacteriales bacterium]|nr:hypothetical protein [Flavobacteriales bacterium]